MNSLAIILTMVQPLKCRAEFQLSKCLTRRMGLMTWSGLCNYVLLYSLIASGRLLAFFFNINFNNKGVSAKSDEWIF